MSGHTGRGPRRLCNNQCAISAACNSLDLHCPKVSEVGRANQGPVRLATDGRSVLLLYSTPPPMAGVLVSSSPSPPLVHLLGEVCAVGASNTTIIISEDHVAIVVAMHFNTVPEGKLLRD